MDETDDFLEAIREFLDLTADGLSWVRDDVPLDHLRLAVDSAGR